MDMAKFKMLTTPSPSTKPLATTIRGVSGLPRYDFQYQLMKPPIALARVNDGTLNIPALRS